MRIISAFVCMLLVVGTSVKAQVSTPEYEVIWRVERGNVIARPYGQAEDFAFNYDGSQIAAADSGATINVWNIETRDVVGTVEYFTQFENPYAPSVSWSPDGMRIATGSSDGVIRIWNWVTGTQLHDLGAGSGYHHSWSPDSTRIATDAMQIFDTQTGEQLVDLDGNWSIPYHAVWSPDGQYIATPGGWEGNALNIWTPAGERFDTYISGYSATWSPDSTRLATSGQIREIASGLPVVIVGDMDGILAWHPNGLWIASTLNASRDVGDTVYLWSAETGELLTRWTVDGCEITGLVWSHDGERFATNCTRNIIAGSLRSNELLIWERVS